MAFAMNMKLLTPIIRSAIGNSQRACLQSSRAAYSCIASQNKHSHSLFNRNQPFGQYQIRQIGSDPKEFSDQHEEPLPLAKALELEIQEEQAELSQHLNSDQFPGFSVETDDADVKLTKQIGDTEVVVRFTVSSSLSRWSDNAQDQTQSADNNPESEFACTLLSLPDFQVQISRGGKTFEVSCFFQDMEDYEYTDDAVTEDPVFCIDEIVMYDGEPRETEFAVSTEYLVPRLQESLQSYLAEHGIDDEFSKNLVNFASNYEKKQYIGLMRRLKDFVSK